MKQLIIILFALFAFNISKAQPVDPKYVPESVKEKFEIKFPGVNYVRWSQDEPGFINANFVLDKHKMQAMFATNGGWISTETTLKESEFPQEALNWINTNYPDRKFVSLDKSETMKGVEYECELRSKSVKYRLTFDTEGKLLTRNESKEK